jgi:hypothetical protein
MTTIIFLATSLFFTGVGLGKAREPGAFHHSPDPPASSVSQDLYWIADTRKMDRFLAEVDISAIRDDAYPGEILPDTRVVWREYARQACDSAAKSDDAAVNERIGQMLKLAALYRQFGGLQNVAQGEEIRALAGQTVQALGYGGLIHSPYLLSNIAAAVEISQRKAAGESAEVRSIFWQHLIATACRSVARISGQPIRALANVAAERPAP